MEAQWRDALRKSSRTAGVVTVSNTTADKTLEETSIEIKQESDIRTVAEVCQWLEEKEVPLEYHHLRIAPRTCASVALNATVPPTDTAPGGHCRL